MNKIKNILVLVLFAVIAVVLVGCGEEPTPTPDPGEIKLPAPTELAIEVEIFKGSEDAPYVIAGEKMYLGVVVNEGADDLVEWSIDRTDRATLSTEDGSAVLTGVKGGFVLVTAKSISNPDLTASKKVEVVDSANFNEMLMSAKAECMENLPDITDSDFKLYFPENEAIKVTYYDKLLNKWDDGIFHYETKDGYTGVYNGTDAVYSYYIVLEYRGARLEQTLTIKVVADAKSNQFVAFENASKKVAELTAAITEGADGKNLLKEDNAGVYTTEVSGQNLPTWDLPSFFTKEEVGEDVDIVWTISDKAAPVVLSAKQVDGKTVYRISYTKPLLDTRVGFDGIMSIEVGKDSENKPIYVQNIVKIYVVAAGYTPDEVYQYLVSQKLIPQDGSETTSISIPLYTYDKTNKFKKVTMEWTVTDTSIMTYVEKSNFLKRVAKGTTTVTGIIYYEKKEIQTTRFITDENGDYVLDDKGNPVTEKVTTIAYSWMKEVTITLTFK